MKLSDFFLPTAKQMLQALAGQLEKAANVDADDMLDRRLADDMFPLSSQIAFSCVQIEQTLARLSARPTPDHEEVPNFVQAQALIAQTIASIDATEPGTIDAAADEVVSFTLPNGMAFALTGAEYVRDWALPQFYFHLMAAYAIMRNCGVPLGKIDYVPHMVRHLADA